jgi:hypothetical protein
MSETGHARNVEHFNTLISYVTAYGTDYQPTNTSIELTALTAKLSDANDAMAGVTNALAAW